MICQVENRHFLVFVSFLMLLEVVQNQDSDEFCRGFLNARDSWKPSESLIRGLQTLIAAEKEFTGDVTFHHTPYLIEAEQMEELCDPLLLDPEPEIDVEGGCKSNGTNDCSSNGMDHSIRPNRQVGKELPSMEQLNSFLDDLFNHFEIDNVFILVHISDYRGL